jgi:hypothetical protein
MQCEKLLERALNHWSGLKEHRMDRDLEVSTKLVLAWRAREVKQNMRKEEKQVAEKTEELRKIGFSGKSKHAVILGTNTTVRLVRRQLRPTTQRRRLPLLQILMLRL